MIESEQGSTQKALAAGCNRARRQMPSRHRAVPAVRRSEKTEMKRTDRATKKTAAVGSGLLSDWKPLLLAIALSLGLVYLGGVLLPKREDALYRILWLSDAALIILCYLANLLYGRRMKYLFQERKLSEVYADLQEKQRSLEADERQAELRLRRSFLFARLWYALMLLLLGFGALLIVPASLQIYEVLLFVYLLWGLLCIWFGRKEDAQPTLEISEKDYPVLFDLVHQAAKTAGCTMPVRVGAEGESVSIFRKPKEIWILMDAVTCALYTKQELYTVLLHEFAHEFNTDTLQTMRLSRELQLWTNLPQGILTGIGGYLLNLPAGIITTESVYYDLFARKRKEELADACAARWGSAQILVNSLAKLSVWSFFEQSTPVPELLAYSEYAGEAPPEDLPARAVEAYRRILPEKRAQWRHRLDVELPPRVSTHPIFRQRREAFGIEDYSFEDRETDPAYLREIDALLAMVGKAIAGRMAEDYEETRKFQYLERREWIEKAKAVTDWSACTIDERIQMAKALAVLEPELEEAVIQSIRRDEPGSPYGDMLLGSKRFRENDPACVELLYRAAEENDNFVEKAYQMIGDFALQNGDQALLDRYRAKVADAIQEARDSSDERTLRWNAQDPLLENDLPRELFEDIRSAILERTEGSLKHLYSVKKTFGEEACYYYFLEFPQSLEEDERSRLQHQVFLYLDCREEQFFLYDLTDEKKHRDYLLKKVPGCEIYSDKGE